MGCCEGTCSCGKGSKAKAKENPHLVQLTGLGLLSESDWTRGLTNLAVDEEVLEIRFKNNRKAFFRNRHGFAISRDDRIVVEVDGGHDIGTVSLTGELALKQFQQKEGRRSRSELRKVYRKATSADLERWLKAKQKERYVLLESRKIATDLRLKMGIHDVEFQGDGRKVTLYYTAGDPINLRELNRHFTHAFGVKVELQKA